MYLGIRPIRGRQLSGRTLQLTNYSRLERFMGGFHQIDRDVVHCRSGNRRVKGLGLRQIWSSTATAALLGAYPSDLLPHGECVAASVFWLQCRPRKPILGPGRHVLQTHRGHWSRG